MWPQVRNRKLLLLSRLIFLPHKSRLDSLRPTRPRVLKWYCPFASQETFPSGHRYCTNVYVGCSHKCNYCYAAAYEVPVRDDQIISTGYVGAPRKTRDSFEHGFCLRDRLGIPHGQRYELCRSVHAEQNAIINAARAGVSLLGGNIYIHGTVYGEEKPIDAFPCFICKKMIINAGLNRLVCSTRRGGKKVFTVDRWARDRDKGDILDDTHQYG